MTVNKILGLNFVHYGTKKLPVPITTLQILFGPEGRRRIWKLYRNSLRKIMCQHHVRRAIFGDFNSFSVRDHLLGEPVNMGLADRLVHAHRPAQRKPGAVMPGPPAPPGKYVNIGTPRRRIRLEPSPGCYGLIVFVVSGHCGDHSSLGSQNQVHLLQEVHPRFVAPEPEITGLQNKVVKRLTQRMQVSADILHRPDSPPGIRVDVSDDTNERRAVFAEIKHSYTISSG